MKKIVLILLVFTMLLNLSACNMNKSTEIMSSSLNKTDSTVENIKNVSKSEEEGFQASKVLIAYFSVPEERNVDGVDAIAGASIVISKSKKLGNTEYVAQIIQETIGGDLFRIETVQQYPLEHDELVDFADKEQEEDVRPELKTHIENLEQYDTIILGYPNWWADLPQALYTFLEEYDFSAKTIIPFVTHGGSGFSDTLDTILRIQSSATISDNTLCLSRNDVATSWEMVVQWAESLELNREKVVSDMKNCFPKELVQLPEEYWTIAKQQGTLQDLYYDTYESFTYAEKSQKLTKHAVVYLPYGYDESKQYPVFYLMHGGWSDETVYLGTPDNPYFMKHILDHGIENGEIQPMIVVCPTYNNTSSEDSGNYSLALQLTNNYHNELVNDLITTVDKTYSTVPDRDHRAFCGFSMGSMTTWRIFQYCLDEFRYFMPSSGGPALNAESYEAIIKDAGYEWNDFFIFAASGTNDFAYSGFKRGIDAMKENEIFHFADNEVEGNLYYLESEGNHSGTYAMMYFYNGLRWIWK